MSDKSKRCVLFMTFRPSQRTLFMARRNWVPLALRKRLASKGLNIYKLQQIFWPRIISDTSTSEKLYDREIKMYFYLANVGFEPMPTSTAAPSNIYIYIYIYIYIEDLKSCTIQALI